MASGKKKKKRSISAKKCTRKNENRHNGENGNRKKNPIAVEEILSQAESAVEMSQVDTALELFRCAEEALRSRALAPAVAGADSKNCLDTKTFLEKWASVLGKMGELKASNGDVEGARSDFLKAIEVFDSAPIAANTNKSIDEQECDFNMAQSGESRAALHLYLGQLSDGIDALSSFRAGVSELEKVVCVLKRVIVASDGQRGDIEMEGGDSVDSENSLRGFLVEIK